MVLTNELCPILDTAPVAIKEIVFSSHSKHDVEIGNASRLFKLALTFRSASASLVAIDCAHQAKTGTVP